MAREEIIRRSAHSYQRWALIAEKLGGGGSRCTNTLLHFDKEGNAALHLHGLHAWQGAMLEGQARFLWKRDRLIIASTALGIYEFERPDKKNLKYSRVFLGCNCVWFRVAASVGI